MFKLVGKEINTILGAQMIPIWTYVIMDHINPKPATIFGPETVICFLCLLHIYKFFSDLILSWKQIL